MAPNTAPVVERTLSISIQGFEKFDQAGFSGLSKNNPGPKVSKSNNYPLYCEPYLPESFCKVYWWLSEQLREDLTYLEDIRKHVQECLYCSLAWNELIRWAEGNTETKINFYHEEALPLPGKKV